MFTTATEGEDHQSWTISSPVSWESHPMHVWVPQDWREKTYCYKTTLLTIEPTSAQTTAGPLSECHLLPVQRRVLQTKAWPCHGLSRISHCGQPLHGRSGRQQHELLQRNSPEPLVWMWMATCIKDPWIASLHKKINSVNSKIKFTRENVKNNSLAFLDCAAHIEEDSLHIGEHRKPTHTKQYLLFDSHHRWGNMLGIMRSLQHWADSAPRSAQGQEKDGDILTGPLRTAARSRNNTAGGEEKSKYNTTIIPYVSGVSEKLNKRWIPVVFKPNETLRQKLSTCKTAHPNTRKSI